MDEFLENYGQEVQLPFSPEFDNFSSTLLNSTPNFQEINSEPSSYPADQGDTKKNIRRLKKNALARISRKKKNQENEDLRKKVCKLQLLVAQLIGEKEQLKNGNEEIKSICLEILNSEKRIIEDLGEKIKYAKKLEKEMVHSANEAEIPSRINQI